MLALSMPKDRFGQLLNSVVSPARPIQNIENLVWRNEEFDRIQKALYMTGRHIFIYGDRGVGKTSLAATAAAQLQGPDTSPIPVVCSRESSFEALLATMIVRARQAGKATRHTEYVEKPPKVGEEKNISKIVRDLKSGQDPIDALTGALAHHSEHPVVVIDEFDRIEEVRERAKFADFIKQLGDRSTNVRIIFTGIGRSLQDLLGAHASAIRQLDTILLPMLPWEGRYEIVRNATKTFDLEIDESILIRIAAISDGYPWYVHKITEKMLWRVFEDKEVIRQISWNHYHAAVNDAVLESYASYTELYSAVVNQRTDDYEEVLWATADSDNIQQFTSDMFTSYEYIMGLRKDRARLDSEKFASRIRNLRTKACGEVLIPAKGKRGVYQYRENMFRAHVRMQAEAHGVQLMGKSPETTLPRPVIHVPNSANKGYFASKPPKGVHYGRKRKVEN